VDGAQEPVVRPEVRAQCRRRLDEPWMAERLAIQAAAAMVDGWVRPAPVVVDTWPRAHDTPQLSEDKRARRATQFTAAREAHHRIASPT
jgi:hypothetical protein